MAKNDIQTLFQRATWNTVQNYGKRGLLGRPDGTVIYTDKEGNAHRDQVWVRLITQNQPTTLEIARNTGVPLQWNLPVRVADVNGYPTVVGTDDSRASVFTGGYLSGVPEHAWTHGRFGPDPLYITGNAFLPLMARPSDPADMTVTVETGFYRYDGTEKVWEKGVSASLSSYVPTGPTIQHFIILCLDRANNTLVVVDGTDKASLSQLSPFLPSEVAAISITDTYFPIAAIRFYYGQTSIKAPDIFLDLRLWGGELYETAGGGVYLPLAGGTMAGTLAMADNLLTRPVIKDYGETVNAIGSIGGGTQDIDLELGNVVSGTVDTSTTTFTFSNPPASGKCGSFTLVLTNGGSQTVNWPTSVAWAGGTVPTLTTTGIDVLTFFTLNAGTTWYGFAAGLDMSGNSNALQLVVTDNVTVADSPTVSIV